MTEDEMAGWHQQLSGHEFEETLTDREGQEAWPAAVHGIAELNMTQGLNNNKGIQQLYGEYKNVKQATNKKDTIQCQKLVQ